MFAVYWYQDMLGGLTSARASKLITLYGYNEIPDRHTGILIKIGRQLVSPIGFMLMTASVLSFLLAKVFDGYFILMLLIVNVVITIWQERKADTAISRINAELTQKNSTLRDGVWRSVPSRLLVPGDLVRLAAGDVVPADCTIAKANRVTVNESAVTGESLPADKDIGNPIYSGSFIASGIAEAEITATGTRTSFAKTVLSVERLRKTSMLEQDIYSIARFLTYISLSSAILLTAVLYLLRQAPPFEILMLDVSLLIAAVPISLPTVMTLIIEFGVLRLAARGVIIRRLSALEDLANVNFLLTDKTGTLTQNRITVQDVYAYDGYTHDDVISFAAALARMESDTPINSAILSRFRSLKSGAPQIKVLDFVPADSVRKRATLTGNTGGRDVTVTMGAPQIVGDLTDLRGGEAEKYAREVALLARSGYRTLAVAVTDGHREADMHLVGLIALSDTLRSDAKSVIGFLVEQGIDVSMVTGDNRSIAAHIAEELALHGGKVLTKTDLERRFHVPGPDLFTETGAFAEILPEDKLRLVEYAKRYFVVAANGDGINDLPAVKAAHVGIAVKNAVSALKATADIVLLSDGIGVIRDAIIESRKIFERLYTYSLYRISESFRLIVTITLLGLVAGQYPLAPLQIILLALLNDIPIISLAFDRVKIANRPSKLHPHRRLVLSSLFGLTGVINSILFYLLTVFVWKLPWEIVQTMFFLKLTVSGHMLIYVAHTKERWYRYLPGTKVIWATTLTQLAATFLAVTGFLMSGRLTIGETAFVWLWAFAWMQVSELSKDLQRRLLSNHTKEVRL